MIQSIKDTISKRIDELKGYLPDYEREQRKAFASADTFQHEKLMQYIRSIHGEIGTLQWVLAEISILNKREIK